MAGVGSCGSARWRLVVAGCHSFVLRRGGVLALILRLSSRPLLVPPSRVASRCSFPPPMSCGLGRLGVLARLIVSVLLVERGLSLCRGVLLCLPASSDLLFSCRRAWRSFSSRLSFRFSSRAASRGRVSSMMCPLRRRGCLRPRGCVSSCRIVERGSAFRLIPCGSGLAAVLVLPSRGRCLLALMPSGDGDNVVLVIGVPACSPSSYGCGA